MKLGIPWLFWLTLVIAILVAVATNNLAWAFPLSCVLLGWFAGFSARSQFQSSHATAVLLVFFASTVVGAMFLVSKSYLFPFTEPSVSFLVGDGWRSIGSSLVEGAVAGAICSVAAVPLYAAYVGLSGVSSK